MPNFIYPRTATFRRPDKQDGAGLLGYGGRDNEAPDNIVAKDVPCSIQARASGRANPVGLPAGMPAELWFILTPLGAIADGQVRNKDEVIDDLGRRFLVTSDYTNSLGGKISVERIET